MAYTSKLNQSGTYDVFDASGAKVTTGSAGILKNYGLSAPEPAPAPSPAAPAPVSNPVPAPVDTAIADNQARAKALGVTIPGIGDRPSPVVSSSSVRSDLTDRGANPDTANFTNEDAYKTFVEQVQPKTAAPAASSLVDTYTGLTTKYGLDKLQSDLSALDAEDTAMQNELRTFKAKEGEGQSASFVSGRISEAERNLLDRQSYITQKKTALVNQIKTANDTISTIMTLTGNDYQNARSVYEFEYNKNLATLQAFQKTQTEAKTDAEKTADDARAKLTTIYNQLSAGGSSVDSLSASQKATIQQLELQAGFPSGFYESIQRANPKSDIISTTTREADGRKYADVVTRGADGALTVQSIPLGASSGGADTFTQTQENSGAANAGMPIAEFQSLDADTKNYFINGFSTFEAQRKLISTSERTKEEVARDIQNSTSLTGKTKEILLKTLGVSSAEASSGGTPAGFWDSLGSILGGTAKFVGSNLFGI